MGDGKASGVYRGGGPRDDRFPESWGRKFETLFSTVTGNDASDDRIAKTGAKKAGLLMVRRHPEIPLHNNPAGVGARARVRKRDVSFGPRTLDGSPSALRPASSPGARHAR
jgi:hypothetical protein